MVEIVYLFLQWNNYISSGNHRWCRHVWPGCAGRGRGSWRRRPLRPADTGAPPAARRPPGRRRPAAPPTRPAACTGCWTRGSLDTAIQWILGLETNLREVRSFIISRDSSFVISESVINVNSTYHGLTEKSLKLISCNSRYFKIRADNFHWKNILK